MLRQQDMVPQGSATAKALLYSLRCWAALTRYMDGGDLPIDNNWVENQIRPIALGRSNWLFSGSLRVGQRAAAVMRLLHSARINGHDPYAYIKDVLTRLPMQPNSRIHELLPHRWQPAKSVPCARCHRQDGMARRIERQANRTSPLRQQPVGSTHHQRT
jgi:transposase